MRKSMRKRYKLFLRTDNFIKKIITITVITAITVATNEDHLALYITKKDITYRNILRRSEKSLKLSLGL